MVNQMLSELVRAGVVSRVSVDEDNPVAYQPARDPDQLTLKFVIDALEHNGNDNIPIARSPAAEKLSENLKIFSDLIEASPANQRLKDI
jgi:membrane protein